jgi:uncharacterized protein YggE
MSPLRIVALLALAAGLAALVARPGGASGGAEADSEHGLTVVGTASVTTVPDRADFSFGVANDAATAAGAIDANADRLAEVILALRRAGVAAPDLQTEVISLSTRREKGKGIVGYTASSSVTARVRALGRAGSVVDAAVRAGATEVYGPSFARSDPDELYRRALRQAYADAHAKAQALASSAGVTLGRMIEAQESGSDVAERAVMAAPSADMPIEPGTAEIRAQVTITFAIP